MLFKMTGEFDAVLMDFDGTTVESRALALPSVEVVRAVKRAINDGVAVTGATGRPERLTRHVTSALGITEYVITNGGSEIIDPTGERPPLSIHQMSVESQKDVLRICQRMDIPVYDNKNQYRGRDIDANGFFHYPYSGLPIGHARQISPENTKLFVEAVDMSTSIDLLDKLARVKEVAAVTSTSWQSGAVVDVHITAADATKEDGARIWLLSKGIPRRKALAIGDSANDLPLIREVGWFAAMGNAHPDIQQEADVVAPSLEQHGVAWVFEEFVLGRAGVEAGPAVPTQDVSCYYREPGARRTFHF